MIIVVKSIQNIEFNKLTELCCDEIEQMRLQRYNFLPKEIGSLRAKDDFYHYLKTLFFYGGGTYFLYEYDGRYIGAVRFDYYQDGVLLNALITAPDMRRKGIAEKLLRFSFDYFRGSYMYSHIHLRNLPSILLHKKLDFRLLHEYAKMLDGSVCNDHVTYIKMC